MDIFTSQPDVTKSHAEVLWGFCSKRDALSSCDFVLALGGSDDNVARRAADVYHGGISSLIVCSGAFGRKTEGQAKTEAATFKDILVAASVPQGNILLEQKSTNTFENFANVKTIFHYMGRSDQTAVAIAQPFAVQRVRLTAQRQWREINWLIDSADTSFDDFYDADPEHAASILAGEIYRIKSYSIKGDVSNRYIPHDVHESYAYFRHVDCIQ